MAREVEQLEGLAVLGHAGLGPLRVPIPALIETGAAPVPSKDALTLRDAEGPIGVRRLVLATGDRAWELRFPVLNPEIAGIGEGVHAVAEGAYLVHAPCTAPALAGLRAQRPELLVLGNARALWNDGRPFVEAIRSLRSSIGPAPLVWAPRVALPHRLPLLAYFGIDLIDTTEGALRSAHGEYFDPTLGAIDAEPSRRERGCDCPACEREPPGSLEEHVGAAYHRARREVRVALRAGRLRQLVETRLPAEPALAEMLRHADRILAPELEAAAPVTGSGTPGYVIAESHRRPEMVRFRTRLRERYRPPSGKQVLLLVPCSKTKPYRRSRSHRRFAGALEGLRPLERLHVVSVSSPIGLVPRELEDVYPARQYDIPVTGEWTEAERAEVLAGLAHLRATGAYRSVIVHLDPAEYSFLREPLPPGPTVRWTLADDRTTSSEALTALRAAARAALEECPGAEGGPLAVVREELRELASFQFGRSAADRLFVRPVRLAGRPWFQRLTDGRTDLATVREERGLFHLTVAGGRRLGAPYPLAVEVDPSLPLAGDLFVPGVRWADPEIRVGDSVVLLRGGELAGVGEAALPGPWMSALGRGLAVRVRHRVARSTDTPMTADASPPTTGR